MFNMALIQLDRFLQLATKKTVKLMPKWNVHSEIATVLTAQPYIASIDWFES